MKHKLILLILLGFSAVLIAQDKDFTLDEDIIGNTYYDLQTWRTMQNRIFYFDDGSIGSVWNMGIDYPNFPDMGVGYNYFDGDSWAPYPSQSITFEWAINPSYTAYGEYGEICFCQGLNGLIMSVRETRGTGIWQQSNFTDVGLKHPVVVTSGVDNNIIQLLYLTADESFTPTPAQPIRGYIWYARSSDGGQTWDVNQQISELGPENYLGFTIGSYCWAEPNEDVIAFVAGDYLTDLVLMKSEDGGDNWQKTIIWEHPYPFLEIFTMVSDTFYCNDGGIDIALDNEDKANVLFTLSRVYSSTEQDTIWYEPDNYGGVVYWNENRPTFSNNLNALNPYWHPDSELVDDYSLVGWLQDINGNDSIDILDDIRTYPTPGMCTMPQILIDELNRIIILYSAVSETYENGVSTYRHIWVRLSTNGEFWSDFGNLCASSIYIISECVYPSIASFIDDYCYFTFQEDNLPGLTDPMAAVYPENRTRFMEEEVWYWPSEWVNASFEADTTIVHEGDTVYFTNYTTGSVPDYITYEWWFEGGIPEFSADTNPAVVYNSQGTFDVQLISSIQIFAQDELLMEDYITVLPAININENNKNENIEVFPNPGNGIFSINLNLENFDELLIDVYNILGELIFHSPINKNINQLKIDLTDQENGIYFIQIKNGSTLITKKIAIQQ